MILVALVDQNRPPRCRVSACDVKLGKGNQGHTRQAVPHVSLQLAVVCGIVGAVVLVAFGAIRLVSFRRAPAPIPLWCRTQGEQGRA